MFGNPVVRASGRFLFGIALTAFGCLCAFAQPQIQIRQTPTHVAPAPGTAPQTAAATGVPGSPRLSLKDVTVVGPGDQVPVIDWHLSTVAPATMTGAAGPSLTDLVVVKPIDASTPRLFERSLKAQAIPTGQLTVPLGDGARFELFMENIRVTSVGRPPDGPVLALGIERVTLTAERYAIRYRSPAGLVERKWDQSLNQ